MTITLAEIKPGDKVDVMLEEARLRPSRLSDLWTSLLWSNSKVLGLREKGRVQRA
jgi:hypothetical protein